MALEAALLVFNKEMLFKVRHYIGVSFLLMGHDWDPDGNALSNRNDSQFIVLIYCIF